MFAVNWKTSTRSGLAPIQFRGANPDLAHEGISIHGGWSLEGSEQPVYSRVISLTALPYLRGAPPLTATSVNGSELSRNGVKLTTINGQCYCP